MPPVERDPTTGQPVRLRNLTPDELEAFVRELGLPPFRARQIFAWVHGRGAADTVIMTDLSRDLRARLAGRVDLEPLQVESVLTSADGTRKLRLRCADGAAVETVLIPDPPKLTQCLSTQVGCGLGCRFCATASMGLVRNLSPGEIVDQVYRARAQHPPGTRLTNLVLMGMGEPLNNLDSVLAAVQILCADLGANFSPRRITLSTAGVVPGIEELGRRNRHLGLAVSLNATTDAVREQLMPINRRWPLDVLLAALQAYPLPRRRRITIEYVLVRELNDTPADARRLVRLLSPIPVKVNLIACNPAVPGGAWQRPEESRVELFAELLRDRNLTAHVRRSRGREIAAACGQLALR